MPSNLSQTSGAPGRGGTGAVALVGRDPEWELLHEGLTTVSAGRSRTVLIEGEAGIGKTRLVEELITAARGEGFGIVAGRAEELETRPFGAFGDALADFNPGRVGAALADALRALLSGNDAFPSGAASESRLVDALLDLVEAEAVGGPLLLILEDLHWADAATISGVRAIDRRLGYLPIFLVGTHRPHPVMPELIRLIDSASREGATMIRLGALSEVAVGALASGMLDAAVGVGLARTLGTASGNPLFVTELIRGLREQGAIYVNEGVAETDAELLPPTLRLTILRRLSFLPADTIELLRLAAILGASFGVEELVVLAQSSGREVASRLEPAIGSKVVGERGDRLRFRHDLIHEAIYEDIPAPLRAPLHVDAARALLALSGSPIRVAEHLLRGVQVADPPLMALVTETAKGLRYAAPRVSVELYQRAIDLLGDSEPQADELRARMLLPMRSVGRVGEAITLAEQLLTRPQDPRTEGSIRLGMIEGKQREARYAECAIDLAAVVDDERYPEQIRQKAGAALASVLALSGDLAEGRRLAEHAVDYARKAGDRNALAVALTGLGGAEIFSGRVAEALEHFGEVLDIDSHQRTVLPHPHVALVTALFDTDMLDQALATLAVGRRREQDAGEVTSLSTFAQMSAVIGFVMGEWDDAVAEARTGIELPVEGIGSSILIILSFGVSAQVSLRRGDLEACGLDIAHAREILAEKGPQPAMEWIDWSEALHREALGDLPRAAEIAWAGRERSAGFRYHAASWRFCAPDLVRLSLATGRLDRAQAVVEDAEEGARRASGVGSAMAAAWRCRGLLDHDVETLLAAVEALRPGPLVFERALACEDAAGCLVEHGKASDARALFEEAVAVYEGLGAVRDVARASAAMRAAGLRRGPKAIPLRPATGWEALTPSEERVARLAAGGLTNPKIAERLFISKYTVMTHLSHVFTKLAISSRVELAAAAAREDREG